MEFLFLIISLCLGGIIGFFVAQKIKGLQLENYKANFQEKINLLTQEIEFLKRSTNTKISDLEHTIQQQETEIEQNTYNAKNELENLRISKNEELNALQNQKNALNIHLERAKAKIEELEKDLLKNKGEVEKLQEKFSSQFENLANKILEEKSQKFAIQNKENISQILNPLQDKILHFEKKVEETNKESIDRNAALRQQISGLKDLNQQMSKEAVNLTKALKGDSKTQGNWGEMILERVLEKSGLEKGREYEVEKSFATNQMEGKIRLRPDVIIHLPDNRKMIIDSKVSLTAYERYVNSTDEEEQEIAIKDHVSSLTRHIQQLSLKKYEDLYSMESPEFVLLFIPVEPAFATALEIDTHLYNKAFDKNIVIVTPSTLLATLRTIETIWKNEKQQRNAIEIARQAGSLYDKFEGLLKDLISIGKKMDDTKKDYSSAMNKLTEGRGNLISGVEKMKKLGAKAKKSLPNSITNRLSDE